MRRTISADIEIRAIARPDLRAELNPRGVKDRMCRLFRRMDRDTRLKEHLLRVNKKKKKKKKKEEKWRRSKAVPFAQARQVSPEHVGHVRNDRLIRRIITRRLFMRAIETWSVNSWLIDRSYFSVCTFCSALSRAYLRHVS